MTPLILRCEECGSRIWWTKVYQWGGPEEWSWTLVHEHLLPCSSDEEAVAKYHATWAAMRKEMRQALDEET